MEEISEKFKAARKELGLTQEEMAEKLGVESGRVYIYKVENGRSMPSPILIKCLEYYLDLTRLKNLLNKQ